MSSQEFLQPQRRQEEHTEVEAPQAQNQDFGIDALLDDIDAVLESNASSFVQGFVQKGGQ
ncbi:ubiquitin-like protein Pup [Actinotignum sanguinis]|uniref:Prokaryotic ubiquitin-like protein Pup n=1 Tax=Schaalia turicensis TaxID=131111 RepID=A0ABZ0RCN1_9ACTO|nr:MULTISPECIES: ubiquitin-like protein Pup [Actinotignum]WPJ89613.1 ubiquitin-like protein Pup [Schaalia turicensis]MDE1553349.1 ubiquitin-like protein Pup [Actinotignum sanguinis]MDE1566016.1 ubiquitin-like protein Pup [Actinotignum sanguinis]MDE1577071.1 ubiquitin-like protein Pup [Actinotignum sanguinis]MDE1642506.1 ubiquitin-like protein Pup [Actinotignum sanguinis]